MNLKKIRLYYLKLKVKCMSRRAKPEDFCEILRCEGIHVGKGTIFYDPNSQTIDRQRPWMLRIGDYCKITKGCTILTHDYSRSVLRRAYGEVIGEAGETVIGNNVFIGINSIILMGSKIGDNVIIGAGSVVGGEVPSNCVVAGNPARVIRSLEEHYDLRKKRTLHEAVLYAKTFEKTYGRMPCMNEMGPFFPLFLQRSEKALQENHINTDLNGDCQREIIDDFLKTKPYFKDFDGFLEFVSDYGNI